MAKKTTRPRKSGGRPPGRRGRGGIGPGPGYKPGGTGKGTRHNTGGCMTAKVVGATILGLLAASSIVTAAQAAGAL